jgi:Putative rhamnosyl transferase
MKHYIITRFNIVVPEWGITTDLLWFRRRIRLFREICYPSVVRQTCQNFEWIVLFDHRTDQDISEFSRITPLMIRENWLTELQAYLAGKRMLLTTRLDSDDALHQDAVATIQQQAAMGWNNLTLGYVKDETGRLWLKRDEANQFLSLKERGNKTALCVSHGAVRGRANQIDDKPYWLHVQHGGNVIPTERYYQMQQVENDLREFGQ